MKKYIPQHSRAVNSNRARQLRELCNGEVKVIFDAGGKKEEVVDTLYQRKSSGRRGYFLRQRGIQIKLKGIIRDGGISVEDREIRMQYDKPVSKRSSKYNRLPRALGDIFSPRGFVYSNSMEKLRYEIEASRK